MRPTSRIAVSSITLILSGSAYAAEPINVVAVTGQAAPVQQGGSVFSTLDYPIINHQGQVAFYAKLSGTNITPLNDAGFFIGAAGGGVAKLAQEGDVIQGLANGTFTPSQFFANGLDASGQVALTGNVTTQLTVIIPGVFSARAGGGVHAVAVRHQPRPDGKGNWDGSLGATLSNGGVFGIGERFNGAWAGTSGASLVRLASTGDSVPSLPNELKLANISPPVLTTNNGMSVFNATTTDGTNAGSVVLASFSGLAPTLAVARSGATAPGTDGLTFSGVTGESANRQMRTLFSATVAGPGVTTANDVGLWVAPNPLSLSPLGIEKVVREGDEVPGEPGSKFKNIDRFSAVIGGNGKVYFDSGVDTPSGSQTVFWEADRGRFKRLLTVGQEVYGRGPGATVGSVFYWSPNEMGQATFGGYLGGTPPFDSAIFGYDPGLGVMVLVREGDKVEVAPGDVRTIASFGLSYGGDGRLDAGNGEDGKPYVLNNSGELAFSATFTDNSQAILTTRVPLTGDATMDGIVDAADFARLWENFGKFGDRSMGDFNFDGAVNFVDFQLLEKNFGRSIPDFDAPAPGAAVVPEPGAALIFVASLGLLLRRRRM